MKYFIIEQIEASGPGVKKTPLGYTLKKTVADQVNKQFDETFGAWIKQNSEALSNGSMNVSEFFKPGAPLIYSSTWETTTLEGIKFK